MNKCDLGFEIQKNIYLVGFFGGTTGRTNQYIVKEIKDIFPDKLKVIKAE